MVSYLAIYQSQMYSLLLCSKYNPLVSFVNRMISITEVGRSMLSHGQKIEIRNSRGLFEPFHLHHGYQNVLEAHETSS